MSIKEFPNDIIIRDKKEISAKALDWLSFSDSVFYHIENYVIPQYGDKGEDQVSSLDASDCIKAIQKYCFRFGKNARPGQQKLDLMKIAHYAQLCAERLKDDNRHGLV